MRLLAAVAATTMLTACTAPRQAEPEPSTLLASHRTPLEASRVDMSLWEDELREIQDASVATSDADKPAVVVGNDGEPEPVTDPPAGIPMAHAPAGGIRPQGSMPDLIRAHWPGGDKERAVAVARCESINFRHDVVYGPTVSPTSDYGLFQINRPTWEATARRLGWQWHQMYDPHVNLQMAWYVYVDAGHSWRPWSCA